MIKRTSLSGRYPDIFNAAFVFDDCGGDAHGPIYTPISRKYMYDMCVYDYKI